MRNLLKVVALSLLLAFGAEAQDFRRYDPTNVNITGGTISGVTLSSGGAITGTTITATTAFNVGDNTVWLTKYAAKQVLLSGDGTGATTNAGFILGYFGVSGAAGIWPSGLVPSGTNYSFYADAAGLTYLNSLSGTRIAVANIDKMTFAVTAGAGPASPQAPPRRM